MKMRWVVAGVGALALAAVAVNHYMPWRRLDSPMRTTGNGASAALSCPANAKAANLNFTLNDASDNPVALSAFKGKVIVLDFWATWCGPCKVEIPHFIEFQNRYGKDGLQVLGVSLDDTADKLQPYARDMKMNYVVLQGLGHDDIQDAFGPMLGIPVTVIISRDGKVCATHTGLTSSERLEQEIQALL
jgi:cytochrome c biogenesis protein CcmG/thiol:disulfide interchange protein DsbE